MAVETEFGWEQAKLYFSTVAGGATPVAANQLATFRGEPQHNETFSNVFWRGQDRRRSRVLTHDIDGTVTIPGVTFDSSAVLTKLMNGTATGATTLHGGAAAATEDKITTQTKPLSGEWLLEGLKTADGKKFQVLIHNAILSGIAPNLTRQDFMTVDLNLDVMVDSSGDEISYFTET